MCDKMKKYEALTKYLSASGTADERELRSFINDIYTFIDDHPEYGLNSYIDILKENNIEWGMADMQNADVSSLNEKAILALLVGAVRAERFCDGAVHTFVKEGLIRKWLTRLNDLDEE